MRLKIAAFVICLVASITTAFAQDLVRLRFDSTTLCIPEDYVPGQTAFGRFLRDNIDGLDADGQSQVIELPARFIMQGVEDYTFSHINKYNVDLEHTIIGIANGMSVVTGNPDLEMPCEDHYDLGYCYQRIVHKDIFFQYSLKTAEAHNRVEVRKFLNAQFEAWEKNCAQNG